MFLKSSDNGKTLCIPTAFVTYHGEALDIKTPLLRSVSALSKATTTFLNLVNDTKVTHVDVTCGCEQEYFLIDKGLYFERPDIVMTGRTLFGAATSRNQQLDDHYFGTVPDRVLAFMQEVEVELYKLGIPAKTRHNEVAPGQFELAPIFGAANVATDNNQLVMAVLQSVAIKHGMVCLLHEKPFAGINGSGKHVNWSMSDSNGNNLLEPTSNPHSNYQFLAITAMIIEAINRHAGVLRTAISSHGNDHRLGANEAPPSIISVFLGDTLTKIYEAYSSGKDYTAEDRELMDLGAEQLANLLKDNTDRNRTSPFAFTGNKFEFRAVGSSHNVGIPMTILNSAVADVMNDMNVKIEADIKSGKTADEALMNVVKDLYNNAGKCVFNGDGYSQEWVEEAERRGLPNLRTSADALAMLNDKAANAFLTKLGVYSEGEIETRFNVRVERYNKHRMIEFDSLNSIIHKDVLPAAIAYKNNLAEAIDNQDEVGIKAEVEMDLLKTLNTELATLYTNTKKLAAETDALRGEEEELITSNKIAKELLPLSEEIADSIAKIEETVSDDLWGLPTYYELLFIK
jgi:glutamine synthetase